MKNQVVKNIHLSLHILQAERDTVEMGGVGIMAVYEPHNSRSTMLPNITGQK